MEGRLFGLLNYTVRSFGENRVVIRSARQPEALQALKERVRRPDMQGRGMYEDSEVLAADNLQQAVMAWTGNALELRTQPESGDVVRVYLAPTEHAERLALLFNTLAPFVEGGSHLDLVDSTRGVWTWLFDGKHAANHYHPN